MKIPVIINGANGKMGQIATEAIRGHNVFELVAKLSRNDDLRNAINIFKAKIVIDLTCADSVYENTLTIINENAHPIIGTSGLIDEQIKHLQDISTQKNLGGIIVPNFSIGAVLMMEFSALAAKYLRDVEIIESHHPQKLDSPSGTALKTAELIAKSRTKQPIDLPIKETVKNARGAKFLDINIHSIMFPGYLASQQVIFGNTGETLSLCHNTIDRSAFMPGLILACTKVTNLTTLHYGLEQLIFNGART